MTTEATILGTASSAAIETSGPCIDEYLVVVREKMGVRAAESTQNTAIDVVSKCVAAYAAQFGQGEVGAGGSGKVKKGATTSTEIPPTTGLIYGKVQSGKTNASMATVALALANGFRVFVVLTSDNVLLGTQTSERFAGLKFGPTIYEWREWQSDPKALGERIKDDQRFEDTGVVLVSTKNTHHLANLLTVLEASGAKGFPAIIVDDEADNASLNTSVGREARAARKSASGAQQDDVEPSKIFERIGDLRRGLPHHVYLQVTATPQALFLQAIDHECRPRFCALSTPGDEYIGGKDFFGDGSKLQVTLSAEEFTSLRVTKDAKNKEARIPDGLRLALACYFLGCAQKHAERRGDDRYSFLAHLDVTRVSHEHVGKVIDSHVSWLDRALRGRGTPADGAAAEIDLRKGWDELSKTCDSLRPLSVLRTYVEQVLRNVRCVLVNAESDAKKITYKPGPNIFVGGNRLGRGVTIENLMVTYYGRDAKTKVMDVVHQHARMFGYRRNVLDVTRLFSTEPILKAFKDIHDADESMRAAIGTDPEKLDVKPVWVGPKMRATKAAVLNPYDLGVIVPGRMVYPWHPLYGAAEVKTADLDARLASLERGVYHPIPIDEVRELLKLMPAEERFGHVWSASRIDEILRQMQAVLGVSHVQLHMRDKGPGVKRDADEATDTAYGADVVHAKRTYPGQPVLFLRRQQGTIDKGWGGVPFWAPTLLIPRDHRFVFTFSNVGDVD